MINNCEQTHTLSRSELMAIQPQQITFAEFSQHLPALFDAIAQNNEPVIVERAGRLFRVEAESKDIWAGYDPERAKEALRRSAGALKGIDLEELKRDIRDARAQDSHGRPAC